MKTASSSLLPYPTQDLLGPGKIGLYFLIASAIGELMAALFDINHQPHRAADDPAIEQ